MNVRNNRWALCIAACLTLAGAARADVKLNGVFGNRMVLQRDTPIPVWGTADAGEQVTVAIGGREARVTTAADGRWRVTLDSLPAGGPHQLVVSGSNKQTIGDVLVGDVWLCSGQSNMAYSMDALRSTSYASDLEGANFPNLRHGTVAREGALEPRDSAAVTWRACDPSEVRAFTAVGFYVARELLGEVKVPIGLLNASWGGTSAESWTSLDALAADADFQARANQQIANYKQLPQQIESFPAAISAWESKHGRNDDKNAGEAAGWASADLDTADWTASQLRTKWKDVGLPDGGVVWIRKEIDVPAASAGTSFRIDFGSVEEMYETTYFNGERLGASGREPPQFYSRYVNYTVPANLVKAGKNVIAIRLVATLGDRQLLNRQATSIGLKALGVTKIDDAIKVKIERAFAPIEKSAAAERPVAPKGSIQNTSGTLYNAMIHPLAGFPVKGVIWYQGEQDASRGYAYRRLLPAMINDWRTRWGRPDLPFFVQQLPNWKAGGADLTQWAELREAQWLVSQQVKNVHIICGLGLGESDDVHPTNKRGVGERIAKSILANAYGKSDATFSGPRFDKMQISGDTVRVTFTHADGLKTIDGGAVVRGFAVAGEDRKFVPVEGKIEGSAVVLPSGGGKPVAVRYAYRNDPIDANLSNGVGLPAFPFRTDDWLGQTDRNR